MSDKEHDEEPEFDPPKITCCATARATGAAYHAPDCKHYSAETAAPLR